jgi:hypothetical protein
LRRAYQKNEENSHLKNFNQWLLQQIRKLKEEEVEKKDMNKVRHINNEENSRSKNHNQTCLCKSRSFKMIKNLWKAK